jgi:hypothetical protein
LAILSDRRLGELLARAQGLGAGIGGTSALLDIDGVPVFAKRVPLTDLERRPENAQSTANLFDLPAFFQYGVGSPGFGAWRELAANTMTTNWAGQPERGIYLDVSLRCCPHLPEADEHSDAVAYWGGSRAVRERFGALGRASASVVLFLEYVPHNVREWLATQLALGAEAVATACVKVERWLRTDVAFRNANGLLH